jgi:hypothetical protein
MTEVPNKESQEEKTIMNVKSAPAKSKRTK